MRVDDLQEHLRAWRKRLRENGQRDLARPIASFIRMLDDFTGAPAPSQPDSEGTREDGIRECVEVVDQAHRDFRVKDVPIHAIKRTCKEVKRRLTALLDKPEPEKEIVVTKQRVREALHTIATEGVNDFDLKTIKQFIDNQTEGGDE